MLLYYRASILHSLRFDMQNHHILKMLLFGLSPTPQVHPVNQTKAFNLQSCLISCADPEGGGAGVWTPPLKNHKNLGFLSDSGPDPLKIHKATEPAFSMLGHHQHASKTPFKWHFAGGQMMARLLWYLDPSTPLQLKKEKKQKNRQSWTPSDKIFWIPHGYVFNLLIPCLQQNFDLKY